MGGSALKNVVTRRFSSDEYFATLETLRPILTNNFLRWDVVPSFRRKESFGDMDIVVQRHRRDFTDDTLKEIFGCGEIVRNGNVVSLDFNELQIDLIFHWTASDYDCALSYYSWGDCSNLMGRIARYIHPGLKLGHDGLSFRVMSPDSPTEVLDEILITKNFGDAIRFIGFDTFRWSQGFDTQEEMFEFIMSGEYFEPTVYFLENRNHVARVRDRKRPCYNAAVEYFTKKTGLNGNEPLKKYDHQLTFERLCSQKVIFQREHDRVIEQWKIDKKYKTLINGQVVSELFGVEGKDLGELMKKIKTYVREHGLKLWISTLNRETTDHLLLSIFKEDKIETSRS